MIEPLNARELEILGLLARGLSNQQVALQLNLSQETVKWYNKHLFSKLGVGSRTQAIAAAQELGLFDRPAQPRPAEQSRPSHNLPAAVTSFIGREKEIAEIGRLLETHRLLVLTGAGGSGKTRLALQVARERLGTFPDGVWLVELAPLVDPTVVIQAVSEVFGLVSSSDEPREAVVQRYLARKSLLLVMDNFEHLLDAAPTVSSILSSAPGVTVLVTSRERLHIYGEYEYPVVPLALPDLTQRESLEQILQYDALRLFFQRAQAVRPGLTMDQTQAAAAVQICTELDGLPLALELAAIQAKIYSLPQLAEQLNNKLTYLPDGPRDLPTRQRTLRATIEWSYSLLNEPEKILFARLAIFRGGATLEAIEEVCQDARLAHIREHLTSLVDKNMIGPREGRDGDLHFTLLETIREYALERLQGAGESAGLRKKHAAYFARLAERADAEIRGARQSYWFARLRAERENVRAALNWALHETDTLDGLRLVAALAYFWHYDGQSIDEARGWAHLATERSKNAPPQLAAGVFICAGRVEVASGNEQVGREKLEKAYQIYQHIGDESNAAWALIYICTGLFGSEDEVRRGISLCSQGLAYFRKVNDKLGTSQALNILGELSRRIGDYEAAKHYYEDCLELSREIEEGLRVPMQYANLSAIAYHQNQPEAIERMARLGIRLFDQLGVEFGVLTTIPMLAGAYILTGEYAKATRLLGASLTLLEDMGARSQSNDKFEIDLYISELRHLYDEGSFQRDWARGTAMNYAQILAYALE